MTDTKPTPTEPTTPPAPPAGLAKASAATWRAIVRDYPPGHFTAANLVLLEQFVRALQLVRQCDRLIQRRGLLIRDKPNPALRLREGAWREVRACATKLRLAISGTVRAEAAAARPDPKHALRRPWEPKR